jgi:hypothetical protein
LSLIAGSAPDSEIQPWRDRIILWVRHPPNEAPTASVRYEIFDDGMAALAWRQRTAQALAPGDGSEGRPEVSRVLMGPVALLTPELAVVVCRTGLPEAIGPRPGKVAVGEPLPAVKPDELDGLVRGQAGELDRSALGQSGLSRVIAAALGDCDTALSVQLPQRVIEKSPQEASQGPLIWGLRRTVWPLLGHDSGARGWSFSTYELPQGDVDIGGLADIVFRTQQQVQPGLTTRREIVVRPHEPMEPPANRYQEFGKLLVVAYQHLGGDNLGQCLDAARCDYGSVDKRIEAARSMLIAALPPPPGSVARRRHARPAQPEPREPQEVPSSEGTAHVADEAADFPDAGTPEDAAHAEKISPPAAAAAAADPEMVTQQTAPWAPTLQPGPAGPPLTDAQPQIDSPPQAETPLTDAPPPDTSQPRYPDSHPTQQPPRTARPGKPRHAVSAPADPRYGEPSPGIRPARTPEPGMPPPRTSKPDMPPPGAPPAHTHGVPASGLGASQRTRADAPPLFPTASQGKSAATGRPVTLVDLLNDLWADPDEPGFEQAVQLLGTGEFTRQPPHRAEARSLMVDREWYLPVLGADPGDLLTEIFSYAVVPDLGNLEVIGQLTDWVEEWGAPPPVIKALNAAAQGKPGAERMQQALERSLGRQWMAKHGIPVRPRAYAGPVSESGGRVAQTTGGSRSLRAFLEGRQRSDPVILLSVACAILFVLLILSLRG